MGNGDARAERATVRAGTVGLALLGATALWGAPRERKPNRRIGPETVAWWTFDGHLRDEVHGLELKNVPNAKPEYEASYKANQHEPEVPVLQIGGETNYRTYYRWGMPRLTHCRLGDELDFPGPFTIEAYLKPRNDAKLQLRKRSYVVRKYRIGKDGKLEAQWLIEIRRRPDQHRRQGDLWVSVTFQKPDGTLAPRELLVRNALRMGWWNRMAVVYDGAKLAILMGGKRVASVDGPGPGARVLPSGGKGWLYITNFDHQVNGKRAPRGKEWLATSYHGRIDELRVTRAALGPDQWLPPVEELRTDPLGEPPRRTEYTSVVRRHLDVLMKHGTDVYGPVHSPLLGSTVDPKTLKMVRMKPPILIGMPPPQGPGRSPLYGCNLDLMRNTLMAMRALSQVTGEAKYAEHADNALRFWFNNCPYPGSGVWPIGEHGVWNFYTDKPEWLHSHEPGAHLDWPRYYKMAPRVVAKEIDIMHKIHCFEHQGLWVHGRHGSPKGTAKTGGMGFARFPGLFARAWAFLYSKTKDPKYLQWAKDQLEVLWQLRDPKTHFVPVQIHPGPGAVLSGVKVGRARFNWLAIWAALGLLDAVEWLDDPADKALFAERAKAIARVNFNHCYKWNGKRFTHTQTRWPFTGRDHFSGLDWLLLKYGERAGRPKPVMDHLQRIADNFVATWRPTKNTDAGCYGWAILFLVQMANETDTRRYLDFARRVGDYAVANLVAENGVLVGSGYYRIYDRMYHVPKLTQALLALDHPKHAAVRPLMREALF